MKTVRGSWYEVWDKKIYGRGDQLKDTGIYNNKREARQAAKEWTEKQIADGYIPHELMIMIVDWIRIMDDDGVVISETKTVARA